MVVLVPYHATKCAPQVFSIGVGTPEVPGFKLL